MVISGLNTYTCISGLIIQLQLNLSQFVFLSLISVLWFQIIMSKHGQKVGKSSYQSASNRSGQTSPNDTDTEMASDTKFKEATANVT